jgi:Family of unknown function (DUF5995)
MTGAVGRGRLLGAIVCALTLAIPAAARADEPVQVRWETLLPPVGADSRHQVRSLPECRKVRLACIDRVARRLARRADAYGCDHRALFPRNYEMLTKVLRSYVARRDFFDDRRYLILQVVLFARLYHAAMDAWERDPAQVPGAWRVALEAWRQGDTFGVQDLLLGINAHVQRDMPFVVAALGMRFRDGRSRKPDHDRGNLVLDAAYEDIVDMVAREYDPTTGVFASPLHEGDDYFGLETVKLWREGVWRNAERLLNARTEAQRARVAAQIEQQAELSARSMAVERMPGHGARRDAYCNSRRQPAK